MIRTDLDRSDGNMNMPYSFDKQILGMIALRIQCPLAVK